ncbi:hypothetical protein [Candidatus Nitronereus thalassa]|uniref:Uncharacterized protein n=1 Tax=Candidatus Nitronereus thalassa TaxID=3020898 RepID=A0ABU3K9Q4_9BACT|nr:hypothetical protein [Candidatus Nitronereus thalassa]MDT7043097.1 hypothetical protein [Candidatus Nitronereus thalassa]
MNELKDKAHKANVSLDSMDSKKAALFPEASFLFVFTSFSFPRFLSGIQFDLMRGKTLQKD